MKEQPEQAWTDAQTDTRTQKLQIVATMSRSPQRARQKWSHNFFFQKQENIHAYLTVCWTCIQQYIHKCIIDKVTQFGSTWQGYSF